MIDKQNDDGPKILIQQDQQSDDQESNRIEKVGSKENESEEANE